MGWGCSTCESEKTSMQNFNEVRRYLGDLSIDGRVGVVLKRNVKWTVFEGVWYEQDPAGSFQTTRAVCC